MAKSARSSNIKKNNSRLKSKVFGPVEQARTERLNKKLQELIQQPKPSEAAAMEIDDVRIVSAQDGTVDVNEAPKKSNSAAQKERMAKKNRIDKKRNRKERNSITFKSAGKKGKR